MNIPDIVWEKGREQSLMGKVYGLNMFLITYNAETEAHSLHCNFPSRSSDFVNKPLEKCQIQAIDMLETFIKIISQ